MNKNIVFIGIILSVLLLFGCTQSTTATGGSISVTPTGEKVWAEDACEYFSLSMVNGVVSKDVIYDTYGSKYVDTTMSCAYIENIDKGKIIAFFMMLSKDYPADTVSIQADAAINEGGEETTGVGEKAWFKKRSTSDESASLGFYAKGVLASVKVNDGVSYEDNKTKVVQLANAIIAKLP
ncbi:MAG: hypothetical protein WCW44_06285 [archaeon]|jgi:hypothetical protein